MNENVNKFIDSVKQQDYTTAKDEFQAAMAEKINSAFENKKIEIAAQMTGEPVVEEETEHLEEKKTRQMMDPDKETMVVKDGKVEVIDKKDVKKFMKKGYELAEAKKHTHDFEADMFGGLDAKLSKGDTVDLKGLEVDDMNTSSYKKYMDKQLGGSAKNVKAKVDRTGMASLSFEVVDPRKVKSVLQDNGIMD